RVAVAVEQDRHMVVTILFGEVEDDGDLGIEGTQAKGVEVGTGVEDGPVVPGRELVGAQVGHAPVVGGASLGDRPPGGTFTVGGGFQPHEHVACGGAQ